MELPCELYVYVIVQFKIENSIYAWIMPKSRYCREPNMKLHMNSISQKARKKKEYVKIFLKYRTNNNIGITGNIGRVGTLYIFYFYNCIHLFYNKKWRCLFKFQVTLWALSSSTTGMAAGSGSPLQLPFSRRLRVCQITHCWFSSFCFVCFAQLIKKKLIKNTQAYRNEVGQLSV